MYGRPVVLDYFWPNLYYACAETPISELPVKIITQPQNSAIRFPINVKNLLFYNTHSFISPNWQPNTENTENKQTVRHNKNNAM